MKKTACILALLLCPFATAAASDTGCPEETKLEEINGWDAFKKTGPYDKASVNKATAVFHKDKRTHIILTNADVSAKQVAENITKSQVNNKGELVLDLVLSNSRKPLAVGEYSPKNRFGKMEVKTTLMVAGEDATASGLSAKDGVVKVSSATEEQICGTFDLATPYGPVKGSFVAPIETH